MPHRARNTSVHLADAIAPPGETQGQRRHIEIHPARTIRMTSERQKLLAVKPQRIPVTVEMLLDQMESERVVSGGNRRVRRKDGCRADEIGGLVKTHSVLRQ